MFFVVEGIFVNSFYMQAKWTSELVNDTAIQKHYLPKETHTKFSLERCDGVPNYNLLVDQS